MTDDIVTRLRNECQCSDDCRAVNDPCIPMRGASEIERLRSALDAEGNEANLLMLEIKRLRAELNDADDDFHALKAMFDKMRTEVRGE